MRPGSQRRGTATVTVLFLNSCVHGGGAGRSLDALLRVPDPRIRPLVVMPVPGVMAARLRERARLAFVPEFVERLSRSPYTWPDRLHAPWAHLPANGYALWRALDRLTDLVRQTRPDVIHCNHMLAKPLGAALGARTGVPVVFHARACHRLWADHAFYAWLGRRPIVRRIICNSQASARVYRRHSGAKVRVIPNCLDPAQFDRRHVRPLLRRDYGLGAHDFVVGFVGRIHGKKGIPWLLRAFARFALQAPRARLAIVGGNDSSLHYDALGRYARLAASLGLVERVIFTGYRDDVRPYLADFDVLAVPSVEPESFGRVLLEAMALEIPVITSAHGGAIEVARDGREGMWVKVNDIDGLAAAMRTLHEDRDRGRTLGRHGRARVERCYTPARTAERVYDVLVEAAEGA